MELSKFSKYCIILVLLPAVYIGFFPGKIVVVQTFCFYLFTFFYWMNVRKWRRIEFDCKWLFILLLIWSFITYVRGFFNIVNFYDWVNLGTGLFFTCFLFPTLLYFPTLANFKGLTQGFFMFGLPLCIVMAIFPPSDLFMDFQHNMYFVLPLFFCISVIPFKYKLIIALSLFFVAFYDLDRRSCFINVFIVLLIYVFYTYIRSKTLRLLLNVVLVLAPLLLGVMALTMHYNVFSEMTKSKDVKMSKDSRALTTDSRSGVYLDVYNELRNKDAFLIGLGGNGKTRTSLINDPNHNYRLTYRYGRGATESGMLNNVQYGGLVGLMVFSILFILASFKATYQSNNDFMMMLGAYVAFKYAFSFVEEPISPQGSSVYMFVWLGMCFNKYLRVMDNNMMRIYFKTIFV